MLPPIPKQLSKFVGQLPMAKPKPVKTKEEKIADIKKKFGLYHGKGKRKRKKGKEKHKR